MTVQHYVQEISQKVNGYNEDVVRLCNLIAILREDISKLEREVSKIKLDSIEQKNVILHIHKMLEGTNVQSQTTPV